MMEDDRWIEVALYGEELTLQEMRQGYHFCPDWGFELIGPDMVEWDSCNCPKPLPLRYSEREYLDED